MPLRCHIEYLNECNITRETSDLLNNFREEQGFLFLYFRNLFYR